MHLSDSNRVERNRDSMPKFWDTVNRIAVTLNLNDNELAEMMEMTAYRLRVLQKYNKEPTVSSAMALSKRVNIGFDALVLNQFDYKLMARQYFGDQSALPGRYSRTALSKRRTALAMLDYIEKYFGWEQRALILRKFQMTEGMFANPDEPIGMGFSIDILEYISNMYRNPEILKHMGWCFTHFGGNSSPFAIGLKKAKTVSEVYEISCGEIIPKIEKNYLWRLLSMTENQCVLEGKPTEELLAMQGSEELMTKSACDLRIGYCASLPSLAHKLPVQVTKRACIANGDRACEFQVDFQEVHAHA